MGKRIKPNTSLKYITGEYVDDLEVKKSKPRKLRNKKINEVIETLIRSENNNKNGTI